MPDLIARLAFNTRVRSRIWKQLAKLLQNRMHLHEALRLLKFQAEERKSPLVKVYAHILHKLGRGRTLGAALDGLASREETLLISSAQDSSRLAGGLLLASKVLDAKSSIRKSLIGALAYPLMLLLLIVIMMLIVSERVMPQLAMLSDPETWQGAAYVLYLQSSFISSWRGTALGIVILILICVVFFSFANWTGSGRRITDRFVPWSIYRLTIGTLWLYAVATRMRAGHQISNILKSMAGDISTSPYLREIVSNILSSSGQGIDFGQALKKSGMRFPSPELVDTLAVYSRMPGFQNHLIELADEWLIEGIEGIQRLAGKIKVFMFALVIGQLSMVALAVGGLQSTLQGGM